MGQGYPVGRVAAGPNVVIGLNRCPALLFTLCLVSPRRQHDEIARYLL